MGQIQMVVFGYVDEASVLMVLVILSNLGKLVWYESWKMFVLMFDHLSRLATLNIYICVFHHGDFHSGNHNNVLNINRQGDFARKHSRQQFANFQGSTIGEKRFMSTLIFSSGGYFSSGDHD